MKVPTSDISRTLLAELKAVREKHQQFQSRVKAADKAARARDDEARKQNAVLNQRIGELEMKLKQANDSIGALQEFIELLPTVKSEVDSFEDEIESFENLGTDASVSEQGQTMGARVNALELDISQIIQLRSSPVTEISEIQSGSISDFSLFDDSQDGGHDGSALEPKDASTIEPTVAPPEQEPHAQESQPNIAMTNREKLELITKLMEQPLQNGDVWFFIPQMWFNSWKKTCEGNPDALEATIDRISTSILVDKSGLLVHSNSDHNTILYKKGPNSYNLESLRRNTQRMAIPASAWHRLLTWYGSDSAQFPRLVMPYGLGGIPSLDDSPLFISLFFKSSPGVSSNRPAMYTPRVLIPRDCLAKTVRSIILNAMPTYPRNHSIQFFVRSHQSSYPPSIKGWYIEHTSGATPSLLEWQEDEIFKMPVGSYIIVSVNVLDETMGSVGPIDPFPAPACPPKLFTWNPSCA